MEIKKRKTKRNEKTKKHLFSPIKLKRTRKKNALHLKSRSNKKKKILQKNFYNINSPLVEPVLFYLLSHIFVTYTILLSFKLIIHTRDESADESADER